eukprot:gb/GEZN01001540.1/.p1 GENE.gb/GEZN01001540.1/~~gb/GEZN01001540.1/.p1  ORF type:complete len:885 (+),score=48.27 gb/GEZN01001540.1/:53-2707(+)
MMARIEILLHLILVGIRIAWAESCISDFADNTPCKFPFTYNNVKYYGCTMVESLSPWCATATDASGVLTDGAWGYCISGDCDGCSEPDFGTKYLASPASCNFYANNSVCQPTCAPGFKGPSSALTCTARQWEGELSGCVIDRSYANFPQCLGAVVGCDDEDPCTQDFCDQQLRCVAVPIDSCYSCLTTSDCPYLGECNTPTCVANGALKRCKYASNTAQGQCKFPFIYNGITYRDCTHLESDMPWCAMEVNSAGIYLEGEWAYCSYDQCSAAHTCGPPVWTERYQEDPTCIKYFEGYACTPLCGIGYGGSAADSINCTANGWSAFTGCAAVPVSATADSQCVSSKTCDDGNSCTFDYCTEDMRCISAPISNCYACTTLKDCPAASRKCDTVSCSSVNKTCQYKTETDIGATCIFPFTVKGVRYHDCTDSFGEAVAPWCVTDYGGHDALGILQAPVWGYCNSKDCVTPLPCDPPQWNTQYQEPYGGCGADPGSKCTPSCGVGFRSSLAGEIQCGVNGWDAFSGCAVTVVAACSDAACDDGDKCTLDYCNPTKCEHTPISKCMTCKTDSDCSDGGSNRVKQCKARLCEYTYKECSDNDPCTSDFWLGSRCFHVKFLPALGVVDDTCNAVNFRSLFSFQLNFVNASDYNGLEIVLFMLRTCMRLSSLSSKTKIEAVDYARSGDAASVTVIMVASAGEDIVTLSDAFLQLIDDGTCKPSASTSSMTYANNKLYTNCLQGEDRVGVYADQCTSDFMELAATGPVVAKKNNTGLAVGLTCFFLLSACGTCFVVYHFNLQRGSIDEGAAEPHIETPHGEKNKQNYSYSPGGTKYLPDEDGEDDVDEDYAEGGGRAEGGGGIDNSGFAAVMQAGFDEDDADPMMGWSQRQEA